MGADCDERVARGCMQGHGAAVGEGLFYFYGQVQSAGGKTDAAIKIDVKGKGLLTIATEKDVLEGLEKNLWLMVQCLWLMQNC